MDVIVIIGFNTWGVKKCDPVCLVSAVQSITIIETWIDVSVSAEINKQMLVILIN